VYAVAARDKVRAEVYGKKHGIEKVYGGPNGYQGQFGLVESIFAPINVNSVELLDDPEIDAVYNPVCDRLLPIEYECHF
jgi:hypothetical protein